MTDCDRLDAHDHDDPRVPEYFHAWLRGEVRHAPALRSWMSQRPADWAFGTVTGQRWTDAQRESHDAFVGRRDAGPGRVAVSRPADANFVGPAPARGDASRAEIRRLHDGGAPIPAIAEQFGVTVRTVYRYLEGGG